jgi:hypothetical protein
MNKKNNNIKKVKCPLCDNEVKGNYGFYKCDNCESYFSEDDLIDNKVHRHFCYGVPFLLEHINFINLYTMFFVFYYFTFIVFFIPSLFFQTLLVLFIIFIILISLNLYTKKLKKNVSAYRYSIKLGSRKKAEKEGGEH